MIAAPSPERQPPAGLTPTEDLFLEVLAARVRLGETCWTFGSEHTRTARSLDAKGLIWWKGGIVEHTIRAFLTDAGRAACLSPTYRAPVTTPKRVQMSRQHPWRAEHPDAVIVDRRTKWGNPYRLDNVRDSTPAKVVAMYLDFIERCSQSTIEPIFEHDGLGVWDRDIKANIRRGLAGRDLACWCPLDQPCHADVLLEIANAPEGEAT